MNKLIGDIREIFFTNIKKKFLSNKKYLILTNDADVFALKQLRRNKRFLDVGVAEQNLVNISAGLAKSGKKPIIYGFCTFLTFRCYEQLRFNVASHNLDVKVIGIGPGYSFPNDGPTHHGLDDLYLMYLIPEFEIINIADNNLADKVSKELYKFKGPTYIRIDKGNLETNLNVKYDLERGFNYTHKSPKTKILILSTGYFANLAKKVALTNKEISVINLFRFKKFNSKLLLREFKKFKDIFIYDESTLSGGITPIIMEKVIGSNLSKKIKTITSKNKQHFIYNQSRDELIKLLKLSEKFLKRKIKNIKNN